MNKVADSFATFFVSFRGQKGAKIGFKLSNSLPNEIANPPFKVKLLKNIRRAPLTKITWENSSAAQSPESIRAARHYRVDFETELGEADTMCVSAPDESEARRMAEDIVASGRVGLKGTQISSIKIAEDNQHL